MSNYVVVPLPGGFEARDFSFSPGGNGRGASMTIQLNEIPGKTSKMDLNEGDSTTLGQKAGDICGTVAEAGQEDEDTENQEVGPHTMDKSETHVLWQATIDQRGSCGQVPESQVHGISESQHGDTNTKPQSEKFAGEDTRMGHQGDYIPALMQKAHIHTECCQELSHSLLGDKVESALHAEPRVGQKLHLELPFQQQREQTDRTAQVEEDLAQNRAVAERLQVNCRLLDCSAGKEERFVSKFDTGSTHSIILKDIVPDDQYRSLSEPIELSTASGQILTIGGCAELYWRLACCPQGVYIRSTFLVVDGPVTTLGGYNALIAGHAHELGRAACPLSFGPHPHRWIGSNDGRFLPYVFGGSGAVAERETWDRAHSSQWLFYADRLEQLIGLRVHG
ncbi:hypothetical protein PV08_01803 [Exophiala spinifera]|uniref:Uncharacterized protein n=1 Tax=Exophiala spinifera TaxID=91928 RepID=A0A0D2BQH2_9EURO|nr:uncharacterized protein PV08_01803 [Exophiala spinifera]KIW21223.1 hypothetical protein PV08_01803 [Exophiala spinifera]